MNADSISATASSSGEWAPPGRWVEGLAADMPLLEALEVIFRQRWRGALYYLPLAAERSHENVEHVHKLRVATRRLSAVLDVLADGFPEAPRKGLYELVEKIRRSCGKARDLDVRRKFLETLLPHASVEDAAVIELLCERAERKRRKVQKKLRKRLPQFEKRLDQAGSELLESLERLQGQKNSGYGSFGETGVRTLLKEMSALWSRADEDLAAGRTLHELRIACKHLRYAVEVFLPMLDETFREDFYPQLEHIQDLLGEIHDASQATRALRRQRKKWKRARHTSRWADKGLTSFRWAELRSGLDSVLLAYAQQADQARTEFLDLWPGFAGDSFQQPVEEALLRLAHSTSSTDGAVVADAIEPSAPRRAASSVSRDAGVPAGVVDGSAITVHSPAAEQAAPDSAPAAGGQA
ncbi:MAG: CHAD domain-containing protein [Planctomycetaceae bacterium]